MEKKSNIISFSPCAGTWKMKFKYINVILYHFIVKILHCLTLKSFKENMSIKKQLCCVVIALMILCISMWVMCEACLSAI